MAEILDNALESFDGIFSNKELAAVRNMFADYMFPVHFAFISTDTASITTTDATADSDNVVFSDFTNSQWKVKYNDILPDSELINTTDGLILPTGVNVLIWQTEFYVANNFLTDSVAMRNVVFTNATYTQLDLSGGRSACSPATRYSIPTNPKILQHHLAGVCISPSSEVPRRLQWEGSIAYAADAGTYQHFQLYRSGLLIANINSSSAKY